MVVTMHNDCDDEDDDDADDDDTVDEKGDINDSSYRYIKVTLKLVTAATAAVDDDGRAARVVAEAKR